MVKCIRCARRRSLYQNRKLHSPLSDANAKLSREDGSLTTHQILHSHLGHRIFILALPTLFQQLLTFCVALFDTWLSGRIDAAATSAIGIAAYIGWLAGLLVSIVCVGTTALVARHLGAGKPEQANRVMHVALIIGQLGSLVMSVSLYLLAPAFTAAFGLEGTTAIVALNYLRLDAIGHALSGITYVGAAALRGSGDMARPMLVLGAINIFNIIFSCCFVYGIGPESFGSTSSEWLPAMGVYGIAAGTISARLLGGVMMGIVLLCGSGAIRLRLHLLQLDRVIVQRLMALGGFAAADNMINWVGQFSFLVIVRNVKGMPYSADVIFAAHMVGLQVEAITYLPAIAWGQSAATIVGQSMGAGKRDRAFQAGIMAMLQCCLLGVIVTGIFYWGADAIYQTMHSDPQIAMAGVAPFRMLAVFQIPLVIFLVLKFALHGAGDTRWPMIATIAGTLLLRLPLAWLLGVHFEMGLLGAWAGMFIDISFRGLVMAGRYLSGRWLRQVV